MIKYLLPLSEIIVDFYDELKSQSSGYASFDYEDEGYRETNIVRMDVLINGTVVDALSCIVHTDKAVQSGRSLCAKLKNVIPKQLFEVYGGDVTRKMKLLQKQKEGKKRMKRIGKVDVPHEAFLAILKR
ncbi:Translation factor GUF1-like protein [Acropora cervicornis]|uniref:Translation factor GUF1-like protein n=1 Tax=Acropora cervicornis TaxID=6130 RepID=A0AAD9QVA8_ACRCE|nr:Translation factor GUF1-like protein [Acropora cervicornis]